MKNKKKLITNILIILIVLIIVLYFSLKDNYEEIIKTIFNMDYKMIIIAIILLCMWRVLIGLSHYLVIKSNNEHVSLLRCIQINFIILFFHGVTPFAGGGGPMEIYYLHNEKISITKSTNITIQNFITSQIAIILIGIFALTYNHIFGLFPSNNLIKKLVILGFIINILVLIGTFIISFCENVQKFLLKYGLIFLYKIKIIKNIDKTKEKISEYISNFHKNAIVLNKNKLLVLKVISIDILAFLTQYSIPFVIALGCSKYIPLIYVIVATSYVMIIGSFIPIPGGTGGIEYSFIFFYNYLITGSAVNAIMLVWRFITYYLGMTLGAIALMIYRKKDVICE